MLQVQSDQSEYRIIKLGKDNTIEHIQFPLLTKSHRTIGERAWEGMTGAKEVKGISGTIE